MSFLVGPRVAAEQAEDDNEASGDLETRKGGSMKLGCQLGQVRSLSKQILCGFLHQAAAVQEGRDTEASESGGQEQPHPPTL